LIHPVRDPHEVFVQADQTLCAAAGQVLPLSHLDPLNSQEEKDKVAKDPKYNPQYVYAPQDQDGLARLLGEVERVELSDAGVGIFFRQARDYIALRVMLRRNLGNDVYWETPIYPMPPERVISLARRILSAPRPITPKVEKPFGGEDQARLVRARLKQYGLNDWQVNIRANLSGTNTDSANKAVNIRAEVRYTMEEMKRLVVHEVDTHVLRAANGYCQPYRIFAVGAVPSYLMTEEGLAVVNEERMGYIDAARTRAFSGRVVAALRALTRPFAEVYAELRDYGYTHDEAYTTTRRVKRGLGDTAAPGGFIKDQAYLWGRLLVEEYVLSGGDLSRLYVGKVALEHVPLIPELGLRPPRYIPYPYS
jgi:hypothetical protein